MPLTSAQQVRHFIRDYPRVANAVYYGDGYATRFELPDSNISSGTAYVQGSNAWTATGAAFNSTGFVEFSGVISANSAFRVTYVHTVFSDEQVDDAVSAYGILGAKKDFIELLLMDAGKTRARWMSPDGSQYDDVGAITALSVMLSAVNKDIEDEAISLGGGMIGWASTQADT